VLILVLLALLLYRYRRTRRVQAFLAKCTPFKVAPYSDLEKQRSSMGADLLFTDGHHGDVFLSSNEKRHSLGYGTILPPPPVTQPDRTASRPLERPDGPLPAPLITAALPRSQQRPGSPMSPFDVSPMSPGFPQSPPPTVGPRRSSQDSLGGISIASSGIFSPSLLSWPMPPSTGTSPPSTSHANHSSSNSHGTNNNTNNLAELQAKYKPLTPSRPTTGGNGGVVAKPMTPVTPASPSNWKKPPGWD
jgi:hypothetical protein